MLIQLRQQQLMLFDGEQSYLCVTISKLKTCWVGCGEAHVAAPPTAMCCHCANKVKSLHQSCKLLQLQSF